LPDPSATVTPFPTPAPTVATPPPVAATPPSLVTLADQLSAQAAAFEQVFGMTAGITPQGGAFLADARHLRAAAFGLRQAAEAGDAYHTSLAYRDIYGTWRRMFDRVNAISPGRTGPNIQQIWRMGDTAAQIGRALP